MHLGPRSFGTKEKSRNRLNRPPGRPTVLRRARALSKASETEIRPTDHAVDRSGDECGVGCSGVAAAAGVFLLCSAWYASLPPSPPPPSCLPPLEFQNLKRFHFASTSANDDNAAAREVQGRPTFSQAHVGRQAAA